MFQVNPMDFSIPRGAAFIWCLGLICGLAAVGFSKMLLLVEDQFEKLPFEQMWWPQLGRSDWASSLLRPPRAGRWL